MSLRVTKPLREKFLSTRRIFSILFLYRRSLITSKLSFSVAVTNFSLGVIILDTARVESRTFLKSLEVTIPTKFSFSTTGIPEILYSWVNLISSPTVLSGEIVIGSLTIPLSNFFTELTSFACSIIGIFL